MFKPLEDLSSEKTFVFNIIQKKGPISKYEIQSQSNIKLTTLNRIMNDLQMRKLLTVSSIGESTGGRKPMLFDVNSELFALVGIDISRTYCQIVITNLKLQVLKSYRFNLDDSYYPEQVFKEIAEKVSKFLTELNIEKENVLGVGVGTVGPIDRVNGIMINPIYFPGGTWENINVKDSLESHLGISVIIDNGANCAALGEYFYGDGRGYENIAYISCGVGIRNAIIASGKIIRTFHDREDVLGHMVVDIDGEQCHCGNFGCLDCYASINSMVKKIKSLLKKGKASSIDKPLNEIDYLDLLLAADKGDPTSVDVITEAALVFATGLANYINLLAPELVILSGPVIYNSELFYKLSVESVLKKIDPAMNIKFNKAGGFREQAIAIGASAIVLEMCMGML